MHPIVKNIRAIDWQLESCEAFLLRVLTLFLEVSKILDRFFFKLLHLMDNVQNDNLKNAGVAKAVQ